MADKFVVIRVSGLPAPWTSPKRGRGRGCIPTPASERMKAWQARVTLAATAAMRGIDRLDGPVALALTFDLENESATVVVEPSTEPRAHTKRPDLTNLIKSTEDALRGIAFKDDAQVAVLMAQKVGK